MKQDFINAVAEKNLAKVRISLTNELLLDPRGVTFSEMLSYAMAQLTDLFEENKAADYSVPSKDEWNEDFLFIVKNDLDFNFSREKLAFYEEVVKTVGRNKAENIEMEEKTHTKKAGEEKDKHSINKTYVTISAGGATLAIIGLAAGKTLLTVVGGVALVVGGVLLLNDKIEN